MFGVAIAIAAFAKIKKLNEFSFNFLLLFEVVMPLFSSLKLTNDYCADKFSVVIDYIHSRSEFFPNTIALSCKVVNGHS